MEFLFRISVNSKNSVNNTSLLPLILVFKPIIKRVKNLIINGLRYIFVMLNISNMNLQFNTENRKIYTDKIKNFQNLKRKLIVLFSVIMFCFNAVAQNFEWAKQLGGSSTSWAYSTVVDANGFVYTAGYFHGTVDFDPGTGVYNLTSVGMADIFISKLDVSGNFVWSKRMGGTSLDYANSIALHADGYIYMTGEFFGTSDFDPGTGVHNLTSVGGTNVFVSKLDTDGNFVWAKRMGGPTSGGSSGLSIAVDDVGNVYTTGRFSDVVDFDPDAFVTYNLTALGGYNVFISKLDALGNFVWAKSMQGLAPANSPDFGRSIAVDAVGNVYSTGHFSETADFDPGPGVYNLTTVGSYDIFISKLNTNGNFVWAKQLGGADIDIGFSITSDASGNIYTTGSFGSTADFDPGPGVYNLTSAGDIDVFVSKLDDNGNFIWAKAMGGLNESEGRSVTLDALGNVYTTGHFRYTADFDPGTGIHNLTCGAASDVFISKLDANGNFVWAKSLEGTVINHYNYGESIVVDIIGNIYVSGMFQYTVDFDPDANMTYNMTSVGPGSVDAFVLKLSQCTVATGTDTRTECSPFTWIDSLVYSADNHTATHTIVNGAANGCDSIVTLDVTFSNIDVSVVQSGMELIGCEGDEFVLSGSSTVSGIDFQWSNGVIDGVPFYGEVGTTNYTLIGTDTNGCVGTVDVQIFVQSPPEIDFNFDISGNCAPVTVTISNTSLSNLAACSWVLGDGTTYNNCGSITHTFDDPGLYGFGFSAETFENGCAASFAYEDIIPVSQAPVSSFETSSNTLSLWNSEVQLTNTSTGANSYLWNFGDSSNSSSTAMNSDYTFGEAGEYLIELIAFNEFGCSDTSYQTVVVEDELIFYIPNTFTPNGDNFNQNFQPVFTSGYDPYDYTLLIFNRWGEIIFESHDVSLGWDGTSATDSRICPDGAYTWKIEASTAMSAERFMRVGNVNLIR